MRRALITLVTLLALPAPARATALMTAQSGNWSSTATWSGGKVPCAGFAVTGAANSSGLIQLTVSGNPTTGNGVAWANGDTVSVYGVGGTTEANGTWAIGNLAAGASTTFTLTGSTFTNAYTSGGGAWHADTVTIADGHSLTLDTAACLSGVIIVGTDPGTSSLAGTQVIGGITYIVASGATPAIQTPAPVTAATGLTIATGATLRHRGDIWLYGTQTSPTGAFTTLTMQAGSGLVNDPKSGAQYLLYFGFAARLVCNGTQNSAWPDTTGGNHCIVKTDTSRGGLAGFFRAPWSSGGTVPQNSQALGMLQTATYTEFSYYGTAARTGVIVLPALHSYFGSQSIDYSVTHCTFDHCSLWWANEYNTVAGSFDLSNNLFTNSVAATDLIGGSVAICLTMLYAPTGGATAQVTNNGFDAQVFFDGNNTTTITGNVFGATVEALNQPTWPDDSYCHDNVIYNGAATGYPSVIQWPDTRDNYFVNNGGAGRFMGFAKAGSTHTGLVFDDPFSSESGAWAVSPKGTLTLKKCMVLGDANGKASAYLCLPLGNGPLTFEHCLQWGQLQTNEGMIAIGSFGTPFAGQVASCRSNIIYATASNSTTFAISEGNSTTFTTDAVTVAGNNCFFNATTGTIHWGAGPTTQSGVTGYQNLAISAAGAYPNSQLGAGDLTSADPQFTDATRKFVSWGHAFLPGAPATAAAVVNALLANPSLLGAGSPNGLIAWVKAGYTPQNTALRGAAHDGTDIGPVAYQSPFNPVPVINGGMRRRTSLPAAPPDKPLRRKAG